MKRLLAALLAAGFLGPLSEAAHRALVPHGVCAAHGELVEVGSGSPGPAASGFHSATPGPGDGHEHCAVHLRAGSAPAPSTETSLVCQGPAFLAPLLPSRGSIATLRLAPKTSPPG